MGVSRSIPVVKYPPSLLDIIVQSGSEGAKLGSPEGHEQSRQPSRRRRSGVTLCGNLKIDFGKQRVTCNDAPVELSSTEFKLVETLAPYTVGPLPDAFDLADVWGSNFEKEQRHIKLALWSLQSKFNDNLPWRRLLWAVCRTMKNHPALQRRAGVCDDTIA